MRLHKTLNSFRQALPVIKHQNPSLPSKAHETTSLNPSTHISLFRRYLSTSPQLLVPEDVTEEETRVGPKSIHSDAGERHLDVTRNGVVKLRDKIEENGVSNILIDSKLKEIEELKKKLNNLEKEVKGMKGHGENNIDKKKNERKNNKEKNVKSLKLEDPPELVAQTKPTSLHAAFTSKSSNLSDANGKTILSEDTRPVVVVAKREKVCKPQYMKKDKPVMKELSPAMATLAHLLHQEGYFEKLHFGIKKEFDLNAFSNPFTRDLLRFAAEKFGQDHQEIAKWLSGSDLKKVALSGCPSVAKNPVFAAKSLRSFFHIQEDIVCRGCKMKTSCKFVNKKVWREKEKLNLADAMRVLVSYSLGPAPPAQMAISQEVQISVDKLLQDVINLSQ